MDFILDFKDIKKFYILELCICFLGVWFFFYILIDVFNVGLLLYVKFNLILL